MALTLILTRHAKSAWDDPTLDDFDRTLNGRGRKSARAIGEWLAKQGYLPDVALVSGARRTVETWERMAKTLPDTTTMESAPALYHGSADTILNVIRTQAAPTLMVICHNPGIAEFAERIVSAPPEHSRFFDYPTAATTIISFDAKSWKEVDWSSGSVLDFVVPRELLN